MSSVCATSTAGLAGLRWLLFVLAIASPVVAAGQGGVLTNGANHTGVIPVGGLDTWTFQATQNDSITIAVGERPSSGADPRFLPRIRLRGPDGTALGDSDGSASAEIDERAPSTGTYTVIVSTADCCTTQTGPGPYFLTLVKTPGPYVVSSGDQGGPMTNGANHTGTIPVGDVDAWTFHANAGESITVGIGEVAGSSDPRFLPRIRLRGPDGESLGDSDGSDAAEIDERAPRAGTYTVLVSTAACCTTQVGTGSYVVTLAKTAGPYMISSGDQGGPLTNGANHAGVIAIGDLDTWTLQANAGDSIAVSIGETPGSAADPRFLPRIRLRAPDGDAVADSDGSDDAELDELAPASGVYTVLVSTAACCTTQVGSAGYVLTVAKTPGTYTVSPGDQGGTLTNGTAYTGEIPVGDMDVWTFSAVSQDNVVLRIGEIAGSGADPRFLPRIRLRGPDGARLDDADGSDDAEIAQRVPSSGTYTVLVSTASCCTSQIGTASYRLTVAGLTATVPLPRVNAFTASPAAINAGQSSTLSWNTANATSVAISSVAGTQPAAGSVTVSPAATTTYTLTATGPGGTATATATVTVHTPPPLPSITSFTASPASIVAGQSSTLAWTTANATTVSIGGTSGTRPANGSVTVTPGATTTYTLTATGAGGTATATATVVVNTVLLPSITSFTASPAAIVAGQSSTLSWTTANATTVSIGGISGTRPVSGSVPVTPGATTTYTLTATGAGGTATATATVTVGSAGALQQLRFSFGSTGRRRAVRTQAAGDDVIVLARRNPDDRFTAPVLAAIDDEPFPQADVAGGVLTLSGTPGGRTLDEWLPAGGTARISIANGDGEQFVAILRRTASDLAVVSPAIAAIGGSAFTPASTLTISGAHFSSRADENTVVLKTPDGRSFPVVPAGATATTLSILVPVIPTAAGTALYEGPVLLHVETAPQTDSNALSFTLLPLPQLQRAPGTETREFLALIDELSGTIQDAASAQLAAAGMPADQLQALRQIPHDVANVLAGQLAGALDGQPQQLLVDYDGAQRALTLDRDAVILFERLLQASAAVDQLRQTAMRARTVLDSECETTGMERFILVAEAAYGAADVMGKIMAVLKPLEWIFTGLSFYPGLQAFGGAAGIIALADFVTTATQFILSAMPIVLERLSLSRDPVTLQQSSSTSVAVHGHFQPILISMGTEYTILKLIDAAIDEFIRRRTLSLASEFLAQMIKSAFRYVIAPILQHLGSDGWNLPLLKPMQVPLSSGTTLATAPSGRNVILGPLCRGMMTIEARAGASGTIGYSVHAHRFSRTANAYSARTSGIIKVTGAPATQPIAAMELQTGGASVQEGQTLTAEVPAGGTAAVALSAARSRSGTGALQYAWTIDGRAASTQRDFTTTLAIGVYTVHLTVRDANGSATAIATVNVVSRFQTVTAGFTMTRGSEQAHEGQTLALLADATGVQVALSGARSFDPQGNPLAYEWRVDGGAAGTGRDLTRTFAPGSFAIRLTVTSTAGVQASATGTVTVTQRSAAQPAITSVTPSAVPLGDTTLTIYGTNLNAAVRASLTGPSCPGSCTFPAAEFQNRTATSFRLNVHFSQSGKHNLTVTNGTANSNSASVTVVQETPETMTGSLTPASPSCTIASGGSSCNVTLSWTTINPVSVSRVTSNYPSANTLIETGNNGSKSVEVPYGGRSFFLYNNGVELDRSNATANCASGTSWNGSRCQSAMSGSLTPASPSCTISSGGSSCNVTLSWTTTNPVDVSRVTSNYPSANTLIETGNNGSKSVEVPYGGRSFFLYNNGVELDRSNATANCASGTSWNGSKCQGAMSGSLTPASPSCTISSGGSSCYVTLSWTTTNPVDVSRVTSNYPSANTLIDTGNSGSESVEVPYGGRSFFLYNNGEELDRSNATASCASGTSWNGSKCQGAMSGSLTPASPSCTISSGGSSCYVTLSWTTTNPVDVSRVTSNYPSANTLIDTGNSGSESVEVPYGGRSFFLYNNGEELDRSNATASCASGTSWNGSKCQGAMSGSLTPASPSCTISSGGSSCYVTLSWTTTNPVDVSRVTSNYPSVNTLIDTGNSGSESVEVPYGGRSFFLYNNGVELDRSNATASCASGTSWNGSKCQGAMSGSLTPASPSCTISSGGSTCYVTLSWTTTNPVDVSRVTSNYPSANTLIDTGNSGSESVEVPYGGRSFFLYNNGEELDRSNATANCASGTSWNGSKCQGAMTGSLTPASPSCTISSGGSSCYVTLSWTTTNPVDVSRVTSNYPSANTLIDTGNSGSESVEVPYGGRSFFLYNNGEELDRSDATASCASGTSWNGSKCQGAMTGSLTPASPSCTISSGGSSCYVTLSWTTTNPVDVSRVTSNYPSANTLIDTGNSGSESVEVPYGGRSFFLYNNGEELDRSNATANCASGTSWNGSKCQGAMTGSLTPSSPSCTISSGGSSCYVTLSWTTTNPVDVSRVTSNYPSANTLIDTGNSGSESVEVPYGGRSFFLYNNGEELDRSDATASCASGTSWNGSKCQGAMTGSLTPASPSCTISSGGSSCYVTLSWTTTNPVDVSRVTSNYPSANTLIDTGNSGSESVEVPHGGRSFFLYNNGEELDRSNATASCASGTSWNGSKCQGAMSGSLTPASPSCTIASGGNSCNVTLSWTTTNPVDVSRVTSSYPNPNTVIDTANNGSKSVPVPYGGRAFFLYNNGVELDRSDATARCTTGTFWNGTRCQ